MMAEYIDKDELLSYLYNLQDEPHDIALEIAQFSAADAAPVVRCKDCQYHEDGMIHWCNKFEMACPGNSEFFCSYGERRESK